MAALGCGERPGRAPGIIGLEVDARDLPRGLLHAREILPVRPGTAWLWFPKWMPGTHAPCGPVENLGGLRITLPSGATVAWRRDDEQPNRFRCEIPPDADRVVVAIDYLCNNPSVNSDGVDSFGNVDMGVVNWNTCLMYAEPPEGAAGADDAVRLRAQIRLPDGWGRTCAIDSMPDDDGSLHLQECSLAELIDAPLLAGVNLHSVAISDGRLRVSLDMLGPAGQSLEIDDEVVAELRSLVREMEAEFPGPAPFAQYHLLTVLSDVIPETGLEHQRCSLNIFPVAEWNGGASSEALGQLAHEFCHAWCGKYRRPAGMVTGDYHRAEHTSLLWVYEGLDMYLGEVLSARAGIVDADGFVARVENFAEEMALQSGRAWRSVEDTAIANWQLRAPCRRWGELRRDQDYYLEGMLFWIEADAIIRTETQGARSLDDVCARFLAVEPGASPRPYTGDDVVAALTAVLPYDWRGLVESRIMRPAASPPWTSLERCGYRVDMSAKPSSSPTAIREHGFDERWSLGMSIQRGIVSAIVPGSAADRARLGPGMRVSLVDGKPLSAASLMDALTRSRTTGVVSLRCNDGHGWRDVQLAYDGGPQRLTISRSSDAPDLLAAIARPRAAAAQIPQTAILPAVDNVPVAPAPDGSLQTVP
ncbi:MAG: hypothetical protein H0W83_06820 [Planctomycetes bacterium]|nr:hypothetical protein [Planctomycetota bacterium]